MPHRPHATPHTQHTHRQAPRRRYGWLWLCVALALVCAGAGAWHSAQQRALAARQSEGRALMAQVRQQREELLQRVMGHYGCWYGYFAIDRAEGIYRYLQGDRYDAYLYLTPTAEDVHSGTLQLYLQENAAPFATAAFTCDGEAVICSQGHVLQQSMRCDVWMLRRDVVDGSYRISDAYDDGMGNAFTYTITLLPWGAAWPQGDATALPPGYDAYQAAVAAGNGAPMAGGGA